jgi:formate hydrogenlyase transcriptional activator
VTTKGGQDDVLRSVALQNANSTVIALRRAEQRSEACLVEAQRLSHTGSFGWTPSTGEIIWSEETFRIFQYDRTTTLTVELILQRVHPEDTAFVRQTIERVSQEGKDFDIEHRLRMPDGSVKHVHVVAHAERNESGELEFVGAVMDVSGRKRAEEMLRRSEADLLEAQRMSQTGSWKLDVSSGIVAASPQMFRIYGVIPDEDTSTFELWFSRTHLEDQKRMQELFERSKLQKTDYDADYRIVLPDGAIKHIHTVGHPVLNESGDLVEFVGTNMDITEQKKVEEELRRSEANLSEGQRLSHTGSWVRSVSTGDMFFSQESYRIFGFDPKMQKVTLEIFLNRVHPEDRMSIEETIRRARREAIEYETSYRIVRDDGSIRNIHVLAHPVKNETGNLVEFVGTHMDVTERKQAEEALRRSEYYLAEAQRLTRTGSWAWNMATCHRVYWSQENYRMFGFDPERGLPSDEALYQRIHPEDRDRVRREAFPGRTAKGSHFDVEFRIVLPDGAIKDLHSVGHPVLNETGDLVEFVGTTMDVTERKQAEKKIREHEVELRQTLDAAPQFLFVLGSDGSRLYANQSVLDFRGLTVEEWQKLDFRERFHPDDAERMAREREEALSSGSPLEIEARMPRHDGKYRWFLFRYKPLKDQQGRITRWVVPAVDIDDRKQSEERLQHENVALREEIDKASMFEEIIGTSPALQTVLSRVSKVAATDSTVLITGETGTGKELVARAIHRRSKRSSRSFISVNCAAIPRDLIPSELFGHEKGAFTGATQQRLGRFELAEGGTIFLDEIGEIPAETQIALLRVLQEHEFERVGGARSIRTDVRVVAATNRDLQPAIVAGTFRSDLFYRLNVFPIEIPALRERREDIPLLVEYFIDRYARKAGKSFQTVNKKTLDLLQAYPWAGNIRELQNVIERSVIVCDTENFSVDESWLSRPPLKSETKNQRDLSQKLATHEKEIIEAALRESGGRVSGRSGAAAKLGIPGPTLESKIRSLKIDKFRFKTTVSSPSRIR